MQTNTLVAEPFPSWTCKLCPEAPDWHLDWEEKIACFDWFTPMVGCKQDPVHHGEGDVATHVKAVCRELINMSEWRSLEVGVRSIVFLAALMHDIAKPECSRVDENGRIVSPGHGKRSARIARQLLWRAEPFFDNPAPLAAREMISSMVRHSSLPFWLCEKEDPQHLLIRASQSSRLDWLYLVASCDARGRICQDQAEILSRIELFKSYAQEQNCFTGPFQFSSGLSRFSYFQNKERCLAADPAREVFDDSKFEVTLMSGLPGAGKSHWIEKNAGSLPVVSLDAIREKEKISFDENQGKVLEIAREEARRLMREKKSFVWNATNITRFVRDPLIRFFHDYGGRVRIVYVEPVSFAQLIKRNEKRSQAISRASLEKLANKLEVPDLSEAEETVYITS